MLVATTLSSGFSLQQSLDAVARDAAEPAAKEFSRALAETRIGSDISDALEHMATRMDSESMRWTTMAIRIQRDVGGNLAETLGRPPTPCVNASRCAVRCRPCRPKAGSPPTSSSPCRSASSSTCMLANYDYMSLLWTRPLGLMMLAGGILAMIGGVFWMRKVVQIEV